LGWTTPTPVDAAWIVFNGVSNAVGQYWWTRALHLAPASAAHAHACAAAEFTPSAHAAPQLRVIGTSVIASMAPHRNTIEIMRLFATYHSAHARFTF
jgi:hypothetical protein